ncbi:N-acetyltransferase, partial [Escherichia coli]|nr:N-acetyltransferase [Escherichia coli]
KVNKAKFAEEAAIILAILNDAWSDNWGFIPLTQPEIDDVGKKLKPLVFEDLIMIAELDDEPVAFMVTLPDRNEEL